MEPDEKLCFCFHVTRRKVTNWIRIHQPRVPSEVSQCGGAGTGCGWCVPFLRKLFDAGRVGSDVEIPVDSATYAAQRAEYLKTGSRSAELEAGGQGGCNDDEG